MAARIIDGKAISEQLRSRLREEVASLTERGAKPCLAVIIVGEDPASKVYVRNKERACKQLGMDSILLRLPEGTTQEELLREVRRLNADSAVNGVLVQLPLPAHLDEQAVLREISPEKDVDGFHAVNAGRLMQGERCTVACTPAGCLDLIRSTGVSIEGAEAVVVGRSNIVGKPMAMLLLQNNATVTICHSRTRNLAEVTRRADILVAAVGRPRMITGDMIKPGAVVIDVGINRVDGKLVGDVDFESAQEVAGWITPVPGGVGPMTITGLMRNTIAATRMQHGIE
ncbi:MAG: bifunctional methylenetetrahydrofolate dehydrogenase/methenyltetrahydrofolate cyclohydrolase FolD [Candidatus Fimadaptatus sp.]